MTNKLYELAAFSKVFINDIIFGPPEEIPSHQSQEPYEEKYEVTIKRITLQFHIPGNNN